MMHDRAVAISRTQMFAPRYNPAPGHATCASLRSVEAASIKAQANFLLLQTLVDGPTTIHRRARYYDTLRARRRAACC